MNLYFKNICVVVLILFTGAITAHEKLTTHTYKLASGTAPGIATLNDVSWLVGSWKGNAFGSQFEEVWNPASEGSMVGMFKLFDANEGVQFYELLLLKQQGDSLVLLVKHFGPDFSAWEEKDDFITFKLVKIDDDAVHFSGLSFFKNGEDKIDGYIVMNHKDGSKTEHHLDYSRVKQQ